MNGNKIQQGNCKIYNLLILTINLNNRSLNHWIFGLGLANQIEFDPLFLFSITIDISFLTRKYTHMTKQSNQSYISNSINLR